MTSFLLVEARGRLDPIGLIGAGLAPSPLTPIFVFSISLPVFLSLVFLFSPFFSFSFFLFQKIFCKVATYWSNLNTLFSFFFFWLLLLVSISYFFPFSLLQILLAIFFSFVIINYSFISFFSFRFRFVRFVFPLVFFIFSLPQRKI